MTPRTWLVAFAVVGWTAFSAWAWYQIYDVYGKEPPEPPYNLSRVPDPDEVSVALHAECGESNQGSELVPALRVPPDYPESARRNAIEGFVELEFLVSAEGTVTEVEVTKAEPPAVFDRGAIHSVSHWHYCPRAESTRSQVRLSFELDEAEDAARGCDRYASGANRFICQILTRLGAPSGRSPTDG